ncbi:hypothetical protein L484_011431 [Morus notabilis]|uniref:Uncharacterized protein n=1 Tax=Morus notabilis TaxID=981085 RepID=W9R778_9ROSA|nr:hypothetical protein L484_011431 [Morus notabilis]
MDMSNSGCPSPNLNFLLGRAGIGPARPSLKKFGLRAARRPEVPALVSGGVVPVGLLSQLGFLSRQDSRGEEEQLKELIRQVAALHCSEDAIDLIPDPKLAFVSYEREAVGKVLSRTKISKLIVRNSLANAQIHGVPPDFFTKENARSVGARAGEVMAMLIPKPESKSWGRFFRVQVLVNIEQPLVVGFFRKDCLHDDKVCKAKSPAMLDDDYGNQTQLYGKWVKADYLAMVAEEERNANSATGGTVAGGDCSNSKAVVRNQNQDGNGEDELGVAVMGLQMRLYDSKQGQPGSFSSRKEQGRRANGAGRVGGLDETTYAGDGARAAGPEKGERRLAIVGGHRHRRGMVSTDREGIEERALTWEMCHISYCMRWIQSRQKVIAAFMTDPKLRMEPTGMVIRTLGLHPYRQTYVRPM